MENTLRILVLVSATCVAVSCGKPLRFTYDGPGNYDTKTGEVAFPGPAKDSAPIQAPELSSEERQGYCAILVDQETDETVRTEFLKKLSGKWERDLEPKPTALDAPVGLSFEFQFDKMFASLSGNAAIPAKELTAKRLCLSKELTRDDQYKGFRVLELQTAEGATAVAPIKLENTKPGRPSPVLLMAEFKFYPYAARESLRSEDDAFKTYMKGEASARLWVYPIKK